MTKLEATLFAGVAIVLPSTTEKIGFCRPIAHEHDCDYDITFDEVGFANGMDISVSMCGEIDFKKFFSHRNKVRLPNFIKVFTKNNTPVF